MPSLASRMIGWSDTRQIRRAFALPLVAVFGLLLRSASPTTQPSRVREAVASVESRSPGVVTACWLLHPPAAVLESQRRTAPVTSGVLAATPSVSTHAQRAALSMADRRAARYSTGVARGYDATAPPRFSV
jgi:hypothetical protein